MNKFGMVSIGFGNNRGETTETVISEQLSRIEITNLKATIGSNPKIEIKKPPLLNLGRLQSIVSKKGSEQVLNELLKVNMNMELEEISAKCVEIQENIEGDMKVVKTLVEEVKYDKFIEKTGSSRAAAEQYITKYPTTDKAVEAYKEHQKKVDEFVKKNQCSRENAIQFLEANDYVTFD